MYEDSLSYLESGPELLVDFDEFLHAGPLLSLPAHHEPILEVLAFVVDDFLGVLTVLLEQKLME
jgi:hypothetical protein